jgi:tetratricopeptide (TPR) repeat protein
MKLAAQLLGVFLVFPAFGTTPESQASQQGRAPAPSIRRAPDRRPVIVQGRVMGVPRLAGRVEVRIETASGVLNDFVFTEATGRFVFRDVSLDPDDFYFVVVEAEGFETYRERMDYQIDSRRGGNLTIFLEPERLVVTAGDGSAQVIDLSQLSQNIPEEARENFERALDDIEDGDFEDAIDRLEGAVELAPDYFDALDALGAEYLRAGRFEDTDRTLNRAHELSPASARPLLNLGTLRYRLGEVDYQARGLPAAAALFMEAIDLFEQSIRRDPNVALTYHNLGQTQYRLEQYAASEASLETALELDPEYDEVRLALVNVYTRQHRYVDALEQVTAYLDQNPNSPRSEALERLRGQIESALTQ